MIPILQHTIPIANIDLMLIRLRQNGGRVQQKLIVRSQQLRMR